jgi:hypothetical protein
MTAAIRYIVLAELSSVGWIRTWIASESPVAILIRNRKNLFNAEPPLRNCLKTPTNILHEILATRLLAEVNEDEPVEDNLSAYQYAV